MALAEYKTASDAGIVDGLMMTDRRFAGSIVCIEPVAGLLVSLNTDSPHILGTQFDESRFRISPASDLMVPLVANNPDNTILFNRKPPEPTELNCHKGDISPFSIAFADSNARPMLAEDILAEVGAIRADSAVRSKAENFKKAPAFPRRKAVFEHTEIAAQSREDLTKRLKDVVDGLKLPSDMDWQGLRAGMKRVGPMLLKVGAGAAAIAVLAILPSAVAVNADTIHHDFHPFPDQPGFGLPHNGTVFSAGSAELSPILNPSKSPNIGEVLQAEIQEINGLISVMMGDKWEVKDGIIIPSPLRNIYSISTPQGRFEISADQAEKYGINTQSSGKQVKLKGKLLDNKFQIESLSFSELMPRSITPGLPVIGPQKWAFIKCKFLDVSTEPKSPEFFQRMIFGSYPSINDFSNWSSYGNVSIDTGGTSFTGWLTLPHVKSYYLKPDGYMNTYSVLDECIQTADPIVNYSGKDHIGVLLNDSPDRGSYAFLDHYINTDGVGKKYDGVILEAVAYDYFVIPQHEYAHSGFRWPWHAFKYENNVLTTHPFDPTGCVQGCPTLVRVPEFVDVTVQPIAWHRYLDGWLSESQVSVLQGKTISNVNLNLLEQKSTGIQMIKIPQNGNTFLSAEYRGYGTYDENVPAGVILNMINPDNASYPITLIGYEGKDLSKAVYRPGMVYDNGNVRIKILNENPGSMMTVEVETYGITPIYQLFLPFIKR